MTDDELKVYLHEAPVARLGSLNPDGTVHLSALWFKYENDEILFGTQEMTNKVRNIKGNPNVTVLVDIEGPPPKGVLVYGCAELDYEDVTDKRIDIFEKYMPREHAQHLTTELAYHFVPVIIRVKPTRISSYDYAKDGMIQIDSAA
jgi:hypothetical protein